MCARHRRTSDGRLAVAALKSIRPLSDLTTPIATLDTSNLPTFALTILYPLGDLILLFGMSVIAARRRTERGRGGSKRSRGHVEHGTTPRGKKRAEQDEGDQTSHKLAVYRYVLHGYPRSYYVGFYTGSGR